MQKNDKLNKDLINDTSLFKKYNGFFTRTRQILKKRQESGKFYKSYTQTHVLVKIPTF